MDKNAQDFKAFQAQTSPYPLLIEIASAKGSYIYGKDGKAYLDFIAGVAVNNFGHNHPAIIAAIKNQVDKHLHVMVYGEFIQEAPLKMVKKLTAILPPNLNAVYPVNSGTEANEAALKLARKVTRRKEILACEGAYHGSTTGSLSLSSNQLKKEPFGPLLPNIDFITFNKIDEVSKITDKTAGIFLETVQGDAGVKKASKEFLQALRKRCDETGTLLIFDEIQCGMGRTGKNFAFEHYGIVPDVLTLGKALGGGMPMGALVSSKANLDSFSYDPILGHITTFGGHPVVCAASAAAIDVMITLDYSKIEEIGQYIEEELLQLSAVKAIRRVGFMFAIDMETPEIVNKVVAECIEHGLLSYWFLTHPESFRLSPPLTLTKEEAKKGVGIIKQVINSL